MRQALWACIVVWWSTTTTARRCHAFIPTKLTTLTNLKESKSALDTASNIPMNTPARASLPDHMVLVSIPGKGLGVVTKVPIASGSVVGDYQGEILSLEEKDRRYLESCSHLRQDSDEKWRDSRIARGQGLTGAYLYGIEVPGDENIYIDAEDEYASLWTRFLNHSSNANVQPKSIHESWDGKPRVWFVALRDIEPGEEICFDYGDDYWLPGDNVV